MKIDNMDRYNVFVFLYIYISIYIHMYVYIYICMLCGYNIYIIYICINT